MIGVGPDAVLGTSGLISWTPFLDFGLPVALIVFGRATYDLRHTRSTFRLTTGAWRDIAWRVMALIGFGRSTYDLRHTRPTFRLFDLRRS